jgi:hypothetical protein
VVDDKSVSQDMHRQLTTAIRDLLEFSWQHRGDLIAADSEHAEDLATHLRAVNAAATTAARASGYLHVANDENPRNPAGDTWGRKLNIRTLRTLGISGLLQTRSHPAPPADVVEDLAAYLAGPHVPCERMFVIDADLPLDSPHTIAGWRMERVQVGDLVPLTPLPSTREFADDPWDEALSLGGCVVLRRDTGDIRPRVSTMFPAWIGADLAEPEVRIAAWRPMLLLNLAATDRVVVAAEYEIEPGRVVDRIRGTGVGLSVDGDDVDTWDVPAWGPYSPLSAELDDMLTATAALEPFLAAFETRPQAPKDERERVQKAEGRLRSSTHRLLAQGPRLGVDGDVVSPRDRAEVLFWFVSALEHLLIPEKGGGDFSRKVAQRTAVMIGDGDEDRLTVYRDVARCYSLRSRFAHGDAIEPEDLDVLPTKAYGYLREVLRTLIILGPHFKVADTCDDALVSASVRAEQITVPVSAVIDALPSDLRVLRASADRLHHRPHRRRRA